MYRETDQKESIIKASKQTYIKEEWKIIYWDYSNLHLWKKLKHSEGK